ncbi:MAG: hypothetical protein IH820_09725 [Bacteroidetes bacterium]|nr:hypothetical protein [Bacteroidota bacterium]
MKSLSLLVEGTLDEAVGRRIIEYTDGTVQTVYGKKGVSYIKKKLSGFNKAAVAIPVLALVDLMDTKSDCPKQVVEEWLPQRHKNMVFRLVVPEIESWIMADWAGISTFLAVSKNKVPDNPEQVADPKRTLVGLARMSHSERIRRLLVPARGSTATEGPAYTSELQRFVRDQWNIGEAIDRAPSLKRCVGAVTRFFMQQQSQEN